MIKIDGNFEEGGGQILRNALALSVYTGKSFHIKDIRKGRKKGGLKAQHLNCIKLLEQLSASKCTDAEIGSHSLEFIPGKYKGGKGELDIGTAGSITLLLQSVLLPAITCKKKTRIRLVGGTDVSWSPQIEYFREVFLPHLRRFAEVELRVLKRGYYPKGGGAVELDIKPSCNPSDVTFDLEYSGKIIQVKGIVHASSSLEGAKISERIAHSAKVGLHSLDCPVNITTQYTNSLSVGCGITLWAFVAERDTNFFKPVIIGYDTLGKKGISSEEVGKKCALGLIKELKNKPGVDRFLCDQLLPFMIFNSKNKMVTSKVTGHVKSGIYVIEKFTDVRFNVDGNRIGIEK